MSLSSHSQAMDMINIAIARDATRRGLLGSRHADPVVPDSPSRLTRARRALTLTRGRRAPARSAPVTTRACRPRPN
jgi:hypothetical protein